MYFEDLFRNIGIESNLKKLGINDANTIINNVNLERLKNNPLSLTKKELDFVINI